MGRIRWEFCDLKVMRKISDGNIPSKIKIYETWNLVFIHNKVKMEENEKNIQKMRVVVLDNTIFLSQL